MKKFSYLIGLLLTISLLQGCGKPPTPNFQQLTLPKTPNYYLACPDKYCNVIPNVITPVYPVSAEDLYNAFNQVVSEERRLNFTYTIPEQGQFLLVDKSWFLNLPDDIAVQFVALSDTTSTLAIYSKSRYGVYDFGTNKRRVDRWLNSLSAVVSNKISS